MLGYRAEDLVPVPVGQVQGSAPGWDAQQPCHAYVVGGAPVTFDIYPLFVKTLDALWGRADLMSTFEVAVSEQRQELTLMLHR